MLMLIKIKKEEKKNNKVWMMLIQKGKIQNQKKINKKEIMIQEILL